MSKKTIAIPDGMFDAVNDASPVAQTLQDSALFELLMPAVRWILDEVERLELGADDYVNFMNIFVSTDPKFIECDSCRAKPGTPTLCSGCLHNRRVINSLRREG